LLGNFPDPEHKAFSSHMETDKPAKRPLYVVSFPAAALWPGGDFPGAEDEVTAEVYQPWLSPVTTDEAHTEERNVERDLHMKGEAQDHGDHVHDMRLEVEQQAVRREQAEEDRAGQDCSETLRRLLQKKGLVSAEAINDIVEKLDNMGRLMLGQKLIARAWVDPEYRERLLEDGETAALELGVQASNSNTQTKLVVVANSSDVHHLVVCTLCSCYPCNLLGMAPPWYKSRSYRARAVKEPRAVLREFGLEVSPEVKVVVHDSTADVRYLVLPQRPQDTQGWTEEQLAGRVTRDSMIGVAVL